MGNLKAALIITILLLTTGCGRITRGEVVAKIFTPEHSWVQLVPIVTSAGKHSYIRYIHIWHHRPDTYAIRITDGEKTTTYYVTEDTYNLCEIGGMFEYAPDRGDLANAPIEKSEATREEIEKDTG